MKKINNKILFVSLIVIFSVLLDQVTKMVAYIQKDKIGDGIKILDFFNIVYVENRGISFGIFSSLDASFYLGILSFNKRLHNFFNKNDKGILGNYRFIFNFRGSIR